MIKYDYTVTVTGNTAKLDKDIYLFRGNKNVHYYFAIKNASFNFKGTTDLIEKTNAINAAVTVVKPNAVEVANAIAPVENGKIHLKVTEDLIDEEVEVGDFDLVFDLFDDTDGAVTIPKVIGQFHVLERPCTTPISELVATNTTNEVDQALTDYAIVTYAEPVASTNADGTFAKKTWVAKEKITTAELNRMEEGISDVSSQCKDIANYSLIKHTDGKVYIKKQDGTLIGDGIEIGGSDVDLSKITMSMSGQTLKLMNDGNQIATVEIPTATVTDEQLTSIIQSKIDDGTLTNMTIVDDSITPQKTDFLSYKDVCVSLTLEDDNSHGYIAKGGKMTNLIDITNATHIYVYCKDCSIIWFSYFVNNNETVKKPSGDLEDWFRDKLSKNISENINEFECDLSEFKSLGATSVKFGFTPADSVDVEKIKISLSTNDISLMEQQDKILNISEKYKKYWNNKIDVDDINLRIKQTPLVDIYKTINTGYSGTLQSQYGSNCNLCYGKDNGYVDVSTNKIIYFKTWCKTATENNPLFGCYDSDKNFLYLSGADNSNVNQTLISSLGLKIENQSPQPWVQDKNGVNIYNKQIWKTVFPDEVKYVIPYTITGGFYHYMALFSYDMLNDFDVLADDYYNNYDENFEKYIKDIAGGKQKTTPKTMVCIGDSLTNWGGGTDGTNGFLKVVHDKTEIMTTNRGLAGAWWQTGDGQTQCAVNRVDYIIANNEKFDLYCFIMGSNAGSTTDTGETSSNKTTMCGAIRYCMETLKAYDPTAQILVCLPPQRAEGNANQLLVNEVIKKIVENEYSVRTLDLYKHSGVVPNTTIADVNYLSDGLHLGDNGQTAIGNVLASEVKYMLCL